MGIHYRYASDENRVYTEVRGRVTSGDFATYCNGLLEDAQVRPGFIETIDVEEDAIVEVTFRDCLPLAEIWERYLEAGLAGSIVLPRSACAYGIFRMFQGAMANTPGSPPVFVVVATPAEMEERVEELRDDDRGRSATHAEA